MWRRGREIRKINFTALRAKLCRKPSWPTAEKINKNRLSVFPKVCRFEFAIIMRGHKPLSHSHYSSSESTNTHQNVPKYDYFSQQGLCKEWCTTPINNYNYLLRSLTQNRNSQTDMRSLWGRHVSTAQQSQPLPRAASSGAPREQMFIFGCHLTSARMAVSVVLGRFCLLVLFPTPHMKGRQQGGGSS